ncbi:Vancomycin resistance protein YoaR, contains peptidoglycan-binding and VanW domains [Selenomonas sp. GACV-9]|uniref:VanW family protein n=1 Tax=Selenomonas sp. GACV-9 TaxID=3158782 RepID=UPI0008E82C45|nr:Vancomycin resistance protein YoaR, contains peptidoglycan-binding and VanW domains [Selenomonas ruminantium]
MNFSSISLSKAAAIITIGMAFTVVVVGSVSVSVTNQNRVIMGVQANGKSLAGMTKKEVHDFFQRESQQALKRPAAVLTYKNRQWSIAPADIDLHGKVNEAAEAAYAIGRNQNGISNMITQMTCALVGRNVTMTAAFDKDKLDAQLAKIQQQLDTPPVNAEAQLQKNGTIKKTPGVIGLTLDTKPIAEELAPQFEALKLTAKVDLQPQEHPPFVMDADLAAIDGVLASYTTRFYPGDRGDNIGLAASHLQGALIRSQSTLSFNSIVGQRTYEAGYKDAGVIVDGEHKIDVGGGVCQVSSTLYNAVLLAGMTPTERANHSLPSAYVPAGRDATVADNLLDFVFRNPLPHPVYLRVSNTGSALTIYVLGTKADLQGQTIALVTEGSAKNPSLYRIWKRNGQVVDREYLHTDHYSDPKET